MELDLTQFDKHYILGYIESPTTDKVTMRDCAANYKFFGLDYSFDSWNLDRPIMWRIQGICSDFFPQEMGLAVVETGAYRSGATPSENSSVIIII